MKENYGDKWWKQMKGLSKIYLIHAYSFKVYAAYPDVFVLD